MLQRLLSTTDREVARVGSRILVPAAFVVTVAIVVSNAANDIATRRFFDNLHWTISYAAAAAVAWLGAVHADARERDARRWFALGLTAYALGQVSWDIQVAVGWNPFPGPSDLLFVCLGPLMGFGLLSFLRDNTTREQQRMIALDVVGLTTAVLALTLALYLPRRGDLALLPMVFLVAYPVVLCWASSVGVVSALTLKLPPHRGWVLFLIALCTNAALWLHWNSLTLDNALVDGSVYNSLFSVAALTQGVGALLWRIDSSPSPRWKRICDGLLLLLPLLLIAVSAVAAVIAFALPEVPSLVRWIALVGGALVVAIASVRQTVFIQQRENLLNAERQLRSTENVYRVLFDHAADAILLGDATGVLQEGNPRASDLLRIPPDKIRGTKTASIVGPGQEGRFGAAFGEALKGKAVTGEWLLRRADGDLVPVESIIQLLPDGRLLAMVRDISERRALEHRLRNSQKMEAVGTLAAGIAHDFNNLITAIAGNAELASMDLEPTHRAAASISEIKTASTRAASLVQQIVAFSRPQAPTQELVKLPAIVEEVTRLLRSTLPSSVEMRVAYDSQSSAVHADPSQLHQVLLNLATNGWQALEGKPGSLLVAVERYTLTTPNALGLPEGTYGCIAVTDTGHGMDAETAQRIFEPFFTTKEVGAGTGLGLATAHTIVRNHGGTIAVESTLGAGTTFRVYLPAAEDVAEAVRQATADAPANDTETQPPCNARVMYVDDEKAIATLMSRQLVRAGFQVQTFTSSEEALAAIRQAPRSFDVIVTDFNMPKLSGLDLLAAARELQRNATLILASGYIDDDLHQRATALGVQRLLQKPYSFAELQEAIAATQPRGSAIASHDITA